MALGTAIALGGLAVSAGSAFMSAKAQKDAARTAGNQATAAGARAESFQQGALDVSRLANEPFAEAGLAGIEGLIGRTGGPARESGLIDQDIARTKQRLDQINAQRIANETFLGRKGGDIKRDANFAYATAQVEKLGREGRELEQQLQGFQSELKSAGRGVGGAGGKSIIQQIEDREAAIGTESDPIFQFQQRNLQRSLAARGVSQSGAGIEAEVGLSASEGLRRQNLRNTLLGAKTNIFQNVAGLGAGAAGNIGSFASQGGANLAQIAQNTGAGLQDAALQRGQAQGSFYSGLGGFAQTAGQTLGNLNLGGGNTTQPPTAVGTAQTPGFFGPGF